VVIRQSHGQVIYSGHWLYRVKYHCIGVGSHATP
jgi:hypothetical protein